MVRGAGLAELVAPSGVVMEGKFDEYSVTGSANKSVEVMRLVKRKTLSYALTAIIILITASCSQSATTTPQATLSDVGGQTMASFVLTSTAFTQGQAIPKKYTCDGAGVSVPLQWTDPPQNTKSFALIVDDPDAPSGTYVHWVIYNLPAQARQLLEGVKNDATLPDGSRNGQNQARRSGYTGPCPPSGTHHYHFKLYALDTTLNLNPGATKDQLLQAMQNHILTQTELMGTYSRK